MPERLPKVRARIAAEQMRKVGRKDLGINGSDRSRDESNAQSILSSAASSAFICREATYRQASANKCSRQEPYDASLFKARKVAFLGYKVISGVWRDQAFKYGEA